MNVNTILQILMKNQTVSHKDRKLRSKGTGETRLDAWGKIGLRIEFSGEVKSVEYFLKSSTFQF